MTQETLQSLLTILKVLADESRLKIIGLLSQRAHSGDELAALLDLKAPTVSHHLARLRDMELVKVKVEGNTHLYTLNGEVLRRISKELLAPQRIASLADNIDNDAWERKVLKDFFVGERLKEIPASRKKRLVVLKWLVDRFSPDKRYTEKQINETIKRHHEDFATLRREFIMNKLMARKDGLYWRLSAAEDLPA